MGTALWPLHGIDIAQEFLPTPCNCDRLPSPSARGDAAAMHVRLRRLLHDARARRSRQGHQRLSRRPPQRRLRACPTRRRPREPVVPRAFRAMARFLYSVHGDRSEANAFAVDPPQGNARATSTASRPAATIPSTSPSTPRAASSPSPTTARTRSRRSWSTTTAASAATPRSPPSPARSAPHRVQQRGVYPHDIPLDPRGRFFYVPCKGSDARHRLSPRPEARRAEGSRARSGAARRGPRHIAFHPRKALAYVINELNSTITTYRLDRAQRRAEALAGRSRRRRRASPATAPAPRSPSSATGASSTSRTVATTASACSRSTPARARSNHVNGCRPAARVPRFFAFDPAERFLYVANQGSHSIVAYRKGRDGKLSPTGIRIRTPSPACIVFGG